MGTDIVGGSEKDRAHLEDPGQEDLRSVLAGRPDGHLVVPQDEGGFGIEGKPPAQVQVGRIPRVDQSHVPSEIPGHVVDIGGVPIENDRIRGKKYTRPRLEGPEPRPGRLGGQNAGVGIDRNGKRMVPEADFTIRLPRNRPPFGWVLNWL